MAFFKPDAFISTVDMIDLERLRSDGITCLLMDLDNTMLPRDTGVVPDEVLSWLGDAKAMGFRVMIVSNNWHASVFDNARELGLPIIYKSMKPFPAAYIAARRRMGVTRKHAVAIGDQLMTDVLGAHLSGMKAIMVLPQAQKDLPHTLLLRKIERLIMGADAKPTR